VLAEDEVVDLPYSGAPSENRSFVPSLPTDFQEFVSRQLDE
jgi:hypothetical protein